MSRNLTVAHNMGIGDNGISVEGSAYDAFDAAGNPTYMANNDGQGGRIYATLLTFIPPCDHKDLPVLRYVGLGTLGRNALPSQFRGFNLGSSNMRGLRLERPSGCGLGATDPFEGKEYNRIQ